MLTLAQRTTRQGPAVHLPRPKRHQVPELTNPARWKISVHGRRWGKSVMALVAAMMGHGGTLNRAGALQGAPIWWVVPKYDLADDCWRRLMNACRDFSGAPGWKRDQTKKCIDFPTGGRLEIKTADDPEMLRSQGLGGVVFDEAAFMEEAAWDVVRPALADHQGWAWFISTPNGMNWFYRLFRDADGKKDWAKWQGPLTCNTVPQEEIDELKRTLGTFRFKQEILAEFLEAGAGFFARDYFRYFTNGGGAYKLGAKAVEVGKCRRVTMVDLAASTKTLADYTVVSTFAITPDKDLLMLDCQRARREGPDQVPMIRRSFERWNPEAIWVEKVGYQLTLIQAARRDGLPIKELARDKDKVSRATFLQARMEGGNVWMLDGAPWLRDAEDELLAFPEGEHDDIVDTMSDGAALVAQNTGLRVW